MGMGMAIFLFAVGVLLVVLEVFIPSFGLLTVLALGSFTVSVLEAAKVSSSAAWAMAIVAPVLTLVVLYYGLKVIPRTSWGRGLVLLQPGDLGEEEIPGASETETLTDTSGTEENAYRRFLEQEGVAKTYLRPAGVVLIDGQRVDVVTEGTMIEAGARVKVVAVEGNRVVVRRVRV